MATAYFAFCEEHRAGVRDGLLAARGGEGAKISVAEVAKELGQRWKQLSDDQRQVFKDTAARNKAAKQQESEAAGEGGAGAAATAAAAAQADGAPQVGLPLSVVKRIILSDKEVGRVSKDALTMIAGAAELFLEMLAEGCAAHVERAAPKRKTIKLDDFRQLLKTDRRLAATGLREVPALVEELAAEAAQEQQHKQQHMLLQGGEQAGGQQGAEAGGEDGQEDEEHPQGVGAKGAADGAAASSGKGGRGRKRKAAAPAAPPPPSIKSFFSRAAAGGG